MKELVHNHEHAEDRQRAWQPHLLLRNIMSTCEHSQAVTYWMLSHAPLDTSGADRACQRHQQGM